MYESCEASWNPAPKVSTVCSTFRRRSACGVIVRFAGSVSSAFRPAAWRGHAAAQLVELRQAEHIGTMNDQRVRGWNVEPGFDDGGREQHVIFAVVEGRHDVVEHGRRHLAVCNDDAHLRHMLVEEILGLGEIIDARQT